MRGIVLDIYVKSEMIKLRFVLKLNLKFWEYRTRFDSKHLFCLQLYEMNPQNCRRKNLNNEVMEN